MFKKCEQNYCDRKISKTSEGYHCRHTAIQPQMVVMMLKDISLLLSFIAAAHETNIDLHLHCERQFLKLAHVFDHISYSRWGTY